MKNAIELRGNFRRIGVELPTTPQPIRIFFCLKFFFGLAGSVNVFIKRLYLLNFKNQS